MKKIFLGMLVTVSTYVIADTAQAPKVEEKQAEAAKSNEANQAVKPADANKKLEEAREEVKRRLACATVTVQPTKK